MDKPTVLDLTGRGHPTGLDHPGSFAPNSEPIDLRGRLAVGEPVEVLSSFNRRWTHGFSVAVVDEAMVKLRRGSDGRILPAWFPAAMIRPEVLH